MDITLSQFPLLSIFHVKGAVADTMRNKKSMTHSPSRNSFHYSGWSKDAICYVESVMIMVTTAMESKKHVWIILTLRVRKNFIEDGDSWVTASQEYHSLCCVVPIWNLKTFSMSLLVTKILLYYPQEKETQSLHAVQSSFQYFWWLERASLECIPVWLFITLPVGCSATLWDHTLSVLPISYEGIAHVYNLFRAFSSPG